MLANSESNTPDLFFLTGLPKTGTTWVFNMLNMIPGVLCRGEGLFFSHGLESPPALYEGISQGLRGWHEHIAHRKQNWLQLDDLIETRDKRNYLPPESYEAMFDRDLVAIARSAMRYFMLLNTDPEAGIRWLGDKTTIMQGVGFQRIRSIFPESRLVIMHRGAQDFVVSLLFQHWRSRQQGAPNAHISGLGERDALQIDRYLEADEGPDGPIPFVLPETASTLARLWAEVTLSAERIQELAPDRATVVQYEDLFRDPETTFSEILKFLGIPAAESLVAEAVERNSFQSVRRSNQDTLKERIRDPNPGGWRRYLDSSTEAIIEKALGQAGVSTGTP